MRKPDNTIVFGSENVNEVPRVRTHTQVMEGAPPRGGAFPPVPVSTRTEAQWFAPPSTSGEPAPTRMRPLSEDLIDESPSYLRHPERGLAFAAVSLALIGVAAVGTYFYFGTRRDVAVEQPASQTTVTNAEVPATPTPTPAPVATPTDQPWDKPEVDAVRAPGLSANSVPAPRPREIPGPQLMPTERTQAKSEPAPPPTYASKIQGAKPAATPTAKRLPANAAQMSDEALERAGYYGTINPIPPSSPDEPTQPVYPAPPPVPPQPVIPQQPVAPQQPVYPSAASSMEPSQFTPQPAPTQ